MKKSMKAIWPPEYYHSGFDRTFGLDARLLFLFSFNNMLTNHFYEII